MARRSTFAVVSLAVALVAGACSSGGTTASPDRSTDHTGTRPGGGGTRAPASQSAAASTPHRSCDPINPTRSVGPKRCPLPFPNDYFTVRDAKSDTGLRVALTSDDMPQNADGKAIDVTEQNRNDGFSPGSALLVDLPGVDLRRSGAAPITDIGASLDRDAPIVIVDTTTGKRHPYWAEVDASPRPAPGGAPEKVDSDPPLLLIHPATDFLEGHRYVVGLRNLQDRTGKAIGPSPDFATLRDTPGQATPELAKRRAGIAQALKDLGRDGVKKSDVALAWDFTIASERSLSERVLHMRDDAFAALGTDAPKFTVDKVTDGADGPLLRTVTGTFEVPRYLTGDGSAGTHLNNGAGPDDPLPKRNGTQTANFICTIPRSAVGKDDKAHPTAMSLYGHGLLGTAAEVLSVGPIYAARLNTTFCATDWIGLSASDIPNAVATLKDLSRFRTMTDRMQQGMLDFLVLGRLMKSPKGFTTDPGFQDRSGTALLDHEHLAMVGLSQGGIMGGATTAIAQDWDRVFLGVPGANYSLLLNRSVDFDTYGAILNPAYPSPSDRQIALQLIQMLWDRGENNGYAQHFTKDPYPGTKPKQMLLLEAFGDHQVTNISTEVLARTMGVKLRTPALAKGRDTAKVPLWDLDPAGKLPAQGNSYLVVWDFGTPAPPVSNLANRAGQDPHGLGATEARVLELGAAWLTDGRLIDTCDSKPCTTPPG